MATKTRASETAASESGKAEGARDEGASVESSPTPAPIGATGPAGEIKPDAGEKKDAAAPVQAEQAKPTRADQFQCPTCKAYGCPAQTGKQRDRHGFTRRRKCSNPKCGVSFSTFEPWAPGSVVHGCGTETVKIDPAQGRPIRVPKPDAAQPRSLGGGV